MRKERILDYVSKKVAEVVPFASQYTFTYWENYGLIRVYVKNGYGKDRGYIQIYPNVKVNLDVSVVYNRQLKEIFESEKGTIENLVNEKEQPIEKKEEIVKIDEKFFVLVKKIADVRRKYMVAEIYVLNYYGNDYDYQGGFFVGIFELKKDFSITERIVRIIKAKMELLLQREKDFLWAYDADITGKIGERVVILKENGNIQTYLVWGGGLRRYQKNIKMLDN